MESRWAPLGESPLTGLELKAGFDPSRCRIMRAAKAEFGKVFLGINAAFEEEVARHQGFGRP